MNKVVKSNRLNAAIQSMSLIEIRIMQLAIIYARETGRGLDTLTPLKISAKTYSEAFNVTQNAGYEAILSAEKTLFNRQFTFLDDKKKIKTRWIQQVAYLDGEGAIEIIFAAAVVEEISRIDPYSKKTFFTEYMLEQTASFSSAYSVRLYELVAQWTAAKKTPVFKIEIFRGQLGLVGSDYERMSDFKRRVLDLAVREVNEKSDLNVKYTQVKDGKTIIGFEFTVHVKRKPKAEILENSNRDQDTPDLFHAMTEKQIKYFGHKLANEKYFSSKNSNIGEDQHHFESRIKEELKDPAKQLKWFGTLKSVGYEPKSYNA